jgi:hypothetical protein
MKQIDEQALQTSLPARIEYITDFLEFTSEDASILHSAAPLVAPLVQTVVDTVYVKLFSYDITKSAFLPRNKSLDMFPLDSEEIKIRKDFLTKWFVKVVSADYTDAKTWEYLNRVGLMHSSINGRPARVEYMHCGILFGYVVSMLIPVVLGMEVEGLGVEEKGKLLVALNKVVWIQNDLFARHYMKCGKEI